MGHHFSLVLSGPDFYILGEIFFFQLLRKNVLHQILPEYDNLDDASTVSGRCYHCFSRPLGQRVASSEILRILFFHHHLVVPVMTIWFNYRKTQVSDWSQNKMKKYRYKIGECNQCVFIFI